ncbi:hypothetical protein [uncultured Jatrophihabitans sp.]|uniref:hypothetical protein n=1 Tax=uncultured Jatrophihabitans sp. TaxID=1610747 RepID=UPI0035CC8EB2
MDLPTPPGTARAVLALAAFVRERLAEVSDSLTPLWSRREAELARLAGEDGVVAATARQFATVITGATAPFAPTSYARARLIRQMHASGLLSDVEARQAQTVLDQARPGAPTGAPRGAVIDVVDVRTPTGTDATGVPRRKPRPRP